MRALTLALLLAGCADDSPDDHVERSEDTIPDCGDGGDGDGVDAGTPACGNGLLEPGEVCDDGNNVDGDGCAATCASVEQCGNGIVDIAGGEVCDDGNTLSGDGCSADCRSGEACGNGIVDIGEECDDGNLNNDDACTVTCHHP